jgi:hypothetical protein
MKKKHLSAKNYLLLQKGSCQKYPQSLGELGCQLDAWYLFETHCILEYCCSTVMSSNLDGCAESSILIQQLMDTLHQALPSMSLIASDFSYLPNVSIPGDRAPLVSSKVAYPN